MKKTIISLALTCLLCVHSLAFAITKDQVNDIANSGGVIYNDVAIAKINSWKEVVTHAFRVDDNTILIYRALSDDYPDNKAVAVVVNPVIKDNAIISGTLHYPTDYKY